MAIEIDMEGKDEMIYGDVFSSGDPVESDVFIILEPTNNSFDLQPSPLPPIKTIEK